MEIVMTLHSSKNVLKNKEMQKVHHKEKIGWGNLLGMGMGLDAKEKTHKRNSGLYTNCNTVQ